MNENDVLDRIKNSDIIITVNSRDGKLFGPQTAIYAKDGQEIRQIGLVQSLELKASVHELNTELNIEFASEIQGMSEHLKKSLKETSSLMAEKGCSVKSSSNNFVTEVRADSIGIISEKS
jgi:hypothetical protein